MPKFVDSITVIRVPLKEWQGSVLINSSKNTTEPDKNEYQKKQMEISIN